MGKRLGLARLVLAALVVIAGAAAALPARPAGAATCTGVCIVKSPTGPSCTGYSSQTTPPATIRVLVHGVSGGKPTLTITPVDFQTYVDNVLPNEWSAGWRPESLKAGAVAVTSYAWYWVTHYGGYLGTQSPATCFDVTDDTLFQVYRANSAQPAATAAVAQTWPLAVRSNGRIVQTGYRSSFVSSTEACGSHATGATMSQWGSQNCALAGYNYAKILEAYYYPIQIADSQQVRTPDDFTFSHRSTRAVYSPATGNWAIDDAGQTVRHFGTAGDIPTVTDTGDGVALIGVFRPSSGIWFQANGGGAIVAETKWGVAGDVPVPAHFRGFGQPTVLTVFRPVTGTWWILGAPPVHLGQAGDIPVPGHYAPVAGDADADHPAVFRPANGTWYFDNGSQVQYGQAGDIPVPGDYNGDGTTDIAVFRPANDRWYVRGQPSVSWGTAGDVPLVGDYNGDGSTDIAVFRPSSLRWYVRGTASVPFGQVGDNPIGAALVHG